MGIPLQQSIIYGPVRSRRLGRSLGINLLPTHKKLCSFDCVYCQYGRTPNWPSDQQASRIFPSLQEVETALSEAFKKYSGNLDRITFSGNGEPTLHPDFPVIAELVFSLRNSFAPETPIVLFTNGSRFENEEIRQSLKFTDEPFLKLDAGTRELFEIINGPARGIDFEKIIQIARDIPHLYIQSMFLDGDISNIGDAHLKNYYEKIKFIRPVKVHIYSLDRPVPVRGIVAVPEETLRQIAERGFQETGIPFLYAV